MNPLKRTVLSALFAGAGAAGSFLLIAVPNVEVLTITMFISGYALGAKHGIVTAFAAALLYFGFNPQGGFFPPLLIAQVTGLSFAPVAGAYFRKITDQAVLNRAAQSVLLGAAAFIVTAVYDLLSNLAFPLVMRMPGVAITGFLIAGIPFAVIHILSNIFIFIFAAPVLLDLVKRHGIISNVNHT